MVFEGLSTFWTLALLGGALATLAGLHLLRTRPREYSVETTLFWREAGARQHPRSLHRRFRQLPAFVLLATMGACLCLAVSGFVLSRSAADRQHVVIVLDAGMSMLARPADADAPRFASALRAASDQLAGLAPADRVCVIAANPVPRVIHRFEQPAPAARQSLGRIEPSREPAQLGEAVRLAALLLENLENPRIVLITGSSGRIPDYVRAGDDAGIPTTVMPIGGGVANAAIVAAVFESDRADATRGRAHVRIGYWGAREMRVRLRARLVTADRVVLDASQSVAPGSMFDLLTEPLDADGDAVEIVLEEPSGTPADNLVNLELPRRGRLMVAVDRSLSPSVALVLEALNCALVDLESPEADLAVARVDAAGARNDRPRIIVVTDGPVVRAGAVIERAEDDELLGDMDLQDSYCAAGHAVAMPEGEANFIPLLVSGRLTLAALDTAGEGAPRAMISDALVSTDADFVRRPAFVMMLARVLALLTPIEDDGISLPAERLLRDPDWATRISGHRPLTSIAGDRLHSDLATEDKLEPTSQHLPEGRWRWEQLLLGATLMLILVEALLHARGRIA